MPPSCSSFREIERGDMRHSPNDAFLPVLQPPRTGWPGTWTLFLDGLERHDDMGVRTWSRDNTQMRLKAGHLADDTWCRSLKRIPFAVAHGARSNPLFW